MQLKTYNKNGPKFGCFWFFNHFLKWLLMVPPQDGFALILVKFSDDILDMHIVLSSIMNVIWMKTCNEKKIIFFIITSSFATQMNH